MRLLLHLFDPTPPRRKRQTNRLELLAFLDDQNHGRVQSRDHDPNHDQNHDLYQHDGIPAEQGWLRWLWLWLWVWHHPTPPGTDVLAYWTRLWEDLRD